MRARKMEFWPRQLMRRLLKSGSNHSCTAVRSNDNGFSSGSDEPNWSDLETGEAYSPKDVPAMLVRGISETLFSEHVDVDEFRLFVGTWNVAGRTPPSDLELEQWLCASEPADIYVIGFQELVPLNPGNVLGAEQDGIAAKWEQLIRRTLNRCSLHRRSVSCADANLMSKCGNLEVIEAFCSASSTQQQQQQPLAQSKVKKKRNMWRKSVDIVDDGSSWVTLNSDAEPCDGESAGRYARIVSKQMVGVFITIWARRDIKCAIRNVKMSCVGCGLMGYLGNKGSVSVSMSLHETSFCFVCAHLTSGEREGDELRRNADVAEILRRTYFHRPKYTWPEMPETIMEHDRVIWFGDLNYRLALTDAHVRMLIGKADWQTLLKKDQLRVEKTAGRVFEGWSEGAIDFAPTYKYVIDTNRYSGDYIKPGERKRTPAWCDRILWNGRGVKQLQYDRAEYMFSDHRPVKAVFLVDVEVFEDSKLKSLWSFSRTHEKAKELLDLANSDSTSDVRVDKELNEEVPLPAIVVC